MRRMNDPIKILSIQFGNYKIVVWPTTVETERRLHHFILYFFVKSVKRMIVIISHNLNHANLKWVPVHFPILKNDTVFS